MNETPLVPVILSGGAGTRLWPLSRELYPKQLLPLVSEQTMLEETALRLAGLPGLQPLVTVCNEEHRFMVAEQLRRCGAPAAAIVLEPAGRNTAPAVALAALQATADGEDPLLLVLPADHVIRDGAAFRAAVTAGLSLAADGALVTFGIVPAAPETGMATSAPAQPSRVNVAGRGRRQDAKGPEPRTRRPGDHGATPPPSRWPPSSKNPTAPPPSPTWPPAATTGTAACSCSAPGPFWPNWSSTPRRCSPPAARPGPAPLSTSTSSARKRGRFWPARPTPSTTR